MLNDKHYNTILIEIYYLTMLTLKISTLKLAMQLRI